MIIFESRLVAIKLALVECRGATPGVALELAGSHRPPSRGFGFQNILILALFLQTSREEVTVGVSLYQAREILDHLLHQMASRPELIWLEAFGVFRIHLGVLFVWYSFIIVPKLGSVNP